MKLELKHLATYLPYGLKVETKWYNFITRDTKTEVKEMDLSGLSLRNDWQMKSYKPILRPLSDFTRSDAVLEHCSEELKILILLAMKNGYIDDLPHWFMVHCFERHYDVFNLIPDGLAIDINTIK